MRLIARPEDKKIMLVLSDGLPWAGDARLQSNYLKWAVNQISKAGIAIGGFGLGCDAVEQYYEINESVVSFPSELETRQEVALHLQEKILSLFGKLLK